MSQIFFISSSKSFLFLLRSFWLHLSNLVKIIEKSIFSSMKHCIILVSICCGGILPSIRRKVFFRVFLLLKKSWARSNRCFFSWFQAFAYQYHGKSTITRDLFIRKKLNNLVFHGIFEHFARLLFWVNILISEDFHTFERQKNANSGKFSSGHWSIFATLFMNSDDVIFILRLFVINIEGESLLWFCVYNINLSLFDFKGIFGSCLSWWFFDIFYFLKTIFWLFLFVCI